MKEKPVVLDELAGVLSRVERIVVKAHPMENAAVLFESTSGKDVDDLQCHLVLEPPTRYFHCMCIGSPAIYLFGPWGSPVMLTNHHGLSVRCSLWSSDVRIVDTDKWLEWFDQRGISGPRQEVERVRAQQEQSKRDQQKWQNAMPQALRPIWQSCLDRFGMVDIAPLHGALEQDMPHENDRVRALLEWFGSGAGPWSGFPSYESAAEDLLLEYATDALVRVIQASSLTLAQVEGAARLFGGWSFGNQRPKDNAAIPNELKTRLWAHVKDTSDKDKLARARNAFGG